MVVGMICLKDMAENAKKKQIFNKFSTNFANVNEPC